MSVNKKHESSIIKYIIAEANNMLINHISVIQNKEKNGLNYHKKVFFWLSWFSMWSLKWRFLLST